MFDAEEFEQDMDRAFVRASDQVDELTAYRALAEWYDTQAMRLHELEREADQE